MQLKEISNLILIKEYLHVAVLIPISQIVNGINMPKSMAII